MMVTTWRDKSGHSNDAYATGTARPEWVEEGLGDLPSMYFETSGNRFGVPDLGLTSYTIFIVMRSPLPDTNAVFFRNDPVAIGWRDDGNEFSFASEPSNLQLPFKIDLYNPLRTNLLTVSRQSSDQGELRVNKEDAETSGSSTRRWSSGNPYIGTLLDGYISEILVYDRVLEEEERDAIEDYLMIKYGLVVQ